MSHTSAPTVDPGPDGDLARARAGDDAAFTRLVEPLRRELHVHCYRMLGSTYDADDALQDALVRAWRGLARFEARSSLRSWLYTVATRTCLDTAKSRGKRALPVDLGPSSDHTVVDDAPLGDVAWLGPYPDAGIEGGPAGPAARYEQREAVELAFVAALQHLPGNQRAALVLFEVLGFSAAEIADMMDTSTASVNSALQRARRIVAERVPSRSQQETLRGLDDTRLRRIVSDYSAALERGDVDALVGLLTEDVTWSMPPLPHWYRGLAAVTDFVVRVPLTCGSWRHVPTSANGQPAVAAYLWDDLANAHLAWSVDVLTLRDERIAAVTAFIGPEHFALLGLPATVPSSGQPHRDEIDAALARRLVAAQFPGWAALPIVPVQVDGWDNRTFRLGDSMTLRLPSADRYVAGVEKEQAWLPRLAPRLPLEIPVPLAVGAPSDDYPWPWSVRRWIDGYIARRDRIDDLVAFARDLAGFLVALQRIDATGGPAPGPHNFHRGAPLAVYDAQTRDAIAALGPRIDGRTATDGWDAALAATWTGAPVWFHGDIASDNLLVDDDGRLTAVIDFGTCGVGDPACDLVIAWTFLAGDGREAFRSLMPADRPMWTRARGWALWKALITITSPDSTPSAAMQAEHVVREVLAEHLAAGHS